MSYISRIGIACIAAGSLVLAACNGDHSEQAPAPEQKQTSTSAQPTTAGNLDSDQARYSYAIGYQIGSSLKDRLEDVDAGTLSQGVKEGLSGEKAKLEPEQMQSALQTYQQAQAKKADQRMQAAAAEGKAFLEANRSKEGVKETDSGLQYQILRPGTGKKPNADDTVEVQYRGTLLNGKEFDSSYSRGEPVTLPVNGVIPGWQEALQMMKVGAKWKIFVPPKLAYGEHGAGDAIGPNETLIFEIELLGIKNDQNSGGTDQQGDQAAPESSDSGQDAAPDAPKEVQPEAKPDAQ